MTGFLVCDVLDRSVIPASAALCKSPRHYIRVMYKRPTISLLHQYIKQCNCSSYRRCSIYTHHGLVRSSSAGWSVLCPSIIVTIGSFLLPNAAETLGS